MIALIDGDLIAFRCAASAENEEEHIAIARAEELLDQIITKVEATEYKLYLSGKSNFRKKIYPEYKANRNEKPKPKWLTSVREFLIEQQHAELAHDDLETDDMLGIEQTEDTIICSLDKDLLQIPGKHFQWAISGANWQKPDKWIEQTEIEGLRLFYEQCLKGDVSDNIKGLPKVGDKTAQKMLAHCQTEKEMFDVCITAYGNDDEFLMNAQCLWILRSFDDNYLDRYERLVDENNASSN